MSIKNFHTVFIVFAIVFDLGLAIFLTWLASPELKERAAFVAPLAGIVGLALVAYLPFHLKKARDIII